MEDEVDFYPEIANGAEWIDEAEIVDEKTDCVDIAREDCSGVAMGQAGKRSRKARRKNSRPVKIARVEVEPEAERNGYISDESDDYSLNVVIVLKIRCLLYGNCKYCASVGQKTQFNTISFPLCFMLSLIAQHSHVARTELARVLKLSYS